MSAEIKGGLFFLTMIEEWVSNPHVLSQFVVKLGFGDSEGDAVDAFEVVL